MARWGYDAGMNRVRPKLVAGVPAKMVPLTLVRVCMAAPVAAMPLVPAAAHGWAAGLLVGQE